MTPEDLAALHARASASPWSVESFASQLAQTGALFVHRSQAFAIGRAVLEEVELLQIATDPDYQRQGHGQRILSIFETQAKTRKCTRAFLEVAQSNTPAIALYTSAGWILDGRRKSYYRYASGAREDALLMSKDL